MGGTGQMPEGLGARRATIKDPWKAEITYTARDPCAMTTAYFPPRHADTALGAAWKAVGRSGPTERARWLKI